VALFTIYKGGKGLGLHKTSIEVALGLSSGIAIIFAAISIPIIPWYANRAIGNAAKAVENCPKVPESTNETDKAVKDAQDVNDVKDVKDDPDGLVVDMEDPKRTEDMAEKEAKEEMDPIAAEWIRNGARDVNTERLFVLPVAIVAAFQSLAHGANDCANAVGPFSAVLAASRGELGKKTEIEMWVFIMAGVFIAVGLLTYGKKVMATLGEKITPMNPSKAFCSLWAVFLVCLIATRAGIPISTTHAAVGSVIGVGLAEGVTKVDWKLMVSVAGSWVGTLPIVGITTAGIFGMFLPAVWVQIDLTQGR